MSLYSPRTSPAAAVEISHNSKVGRASATYCSQASCPASCPFAGCGCYAELGMVNIFTAHLNQVRATPREIAIAEAEGIRGLSGRRDLRLHVVGDCPNGECAGIVSRAADEYRIKYAREVWTYTHSWREVRRTCWGKVSVLASCESVLQLDDAHARGYATELTVPWHKGERAYRIEGFGFTAIPCPNQTRGVQCVECRLCMRDDYLRRNRMVIAIAAHGIRKAAARKVLG